MILVTGFNSIVQKSWKTCTFTQKRLDHLLPRTSYLVTIETDDHWTWLKMHSRDERIDTENIRHQVLMFYPVGKIWKMILGGGGGLNHDLTGIIYNTFLKRPRLIYIMLRKSDLNFWKVGSILEVLAAWSYKALIISFSISQPEKNYIQSSKFNGKIWTITV